MIEASNVRRIRGKRADELHMQLCAKIEQGIKNAAMDSFTELLVQLPSPSEIQHAHPSSIRLEAYAYDIERLQAVLDKAGYEVNNTAYKNSFMIRW